MILIANSKLLYFEQCLKPFVVLEFCKSGTFTNGERRNLSHRRFSILDICVIYGYNLLLLTCPSSNFDGLSGIVNKYAQCHELSTYWKMSIRKRFPHSLGRYVEV